MTDPLIDLAEALASQLQQQFPALPLGEDIALPITFEWTDNADLDLADAAIVNPLVRVLDFADTLSSDGGQDFADYELLVAPQMKIPSNRTAIEIRRAMGGLTAAIAEFCRPEDDVCELIVGDKVYACMKAERKPAVDPDEWRTKRQYLAILSTVWRIFR